MKNKFLKKAIVSLMVIISIVTVETIFSVKADARGYSYRMEDGYQGPGWYNDGYSTGVGWYNDGYNWYLYNEYGQMRVGWYNTGYSWYHFDAYGAMTTGWYYENGQYYYFNNDGTI